MNIQVKFKIRLDIISRSQSVSRWSIWIFFFFIRSFWFFFRCFCYRSLNSCSSTFREHTFFHFNAQPTKLKPFRFNRKTRTFIVCDENKHIHHIVCAYKWKIESKLLLEWKSNWGPHIRQYYKFVEEIKQLWRKTKWNKK